VRQSSDLDLVIADLSRDLTGSTSVTGSVAGAALSCPTLTLAGVVLTGTAITQNI